MLLRNFVDKQLTVAIEGKSLQGYSQKSLARLRPARPLQGNCNKRACLSRTFKAEGTGIEPATPYGALHFQ